MKKLFLLMAVFGFVFALSACETDDDTGKTMDDQEQVDDNQDDQNQDQSLRLTIDELAMYDGQDGMDAYVAVNGTIYDVTGVEAWTGGSHNGNMAGQDLSDVINNSPHGVSVLDGLTVVGEIVEGEASNDTLQLTLAELAEYDGQDGAMAYVAVNGVIYDVTGVSAWTGGSHNGNMAGQDLSNVINNSPHGTSVLEGLTMVGELVE